MAHVCALVTCALLLVAPAAVAAVPKPPALDARAWTLIDPRDGSVIASQEANKQLPIASTTKLMTAYLVLHHLRPNQMLTAPVYHPQASAEVELGLRPGERMRVRDLLYGLLLPSASDAAVTLADGVAGSVPAFVNQMNATAQKLGLTHTHYENPIGLDSPKNYSTASDLAKLASIDLKNNLFARIVDTPAATLSSGDHPRTVTSRNTLIGQVPWINGVKTGHTLGAGYVLVGSGTQNSTTLISAVLGTTSEASRDATTLALLEYGFSLYHPVVPVHAGQQLADPALDYRSGHVGLVARRAVAVNVRRGQRVATQVTAPSEVSGAHKKGDVLGHVTVTVDGSPAASIPLVASHDVAAATTLDKITSRAENPFLLIAVGAIVILLVVFLTVRRRGHGEPASATSPPVGREGRQAPRQRTPEERRRMHEERMRRRRERSKRQEGTG